jgi:hypothetical protein
MMMDADLFFAILTTAGLSVVATVAGYRISDRYPGIRTPLFACVILATAWYASTWAGRVENARLFPVASAILLSNLTPVLACFLAGLAWQMKQIPLMRRSIVLGSFVALATLFFLAPVLRPAFKPIRTSEQGSWRNGVCMQTHDASCGAAAVATMLRQFGLFANETDLTEDCLTSTAGTEPLSLYRAMTIRGREAGIRPQIADRNPESWENHGQYPVLAMVAPAQSESPQQSGNGRLRHLFGRSSEGHAVVVLGRQSDGDYVIGDPSHGRTTWTPYEMSIYFSGQAFCMKALAD